MLLGTTEGWFSSIYNIPFALQLAQTCTLILLLVWWWSFVNNAKKVDLLLLTVCISPAIRLPLYFQGKVVCYLHIFTSLSLTSLLPLFPPLPRTHCDPLASVSHAEITSHHTQLSENRSWFLIFILSSSAHPYSVGHLETSFLWVVCSGLWCVVLSFENALVYVFCPWRIQWSYCRLLEINLFQSFVCIWLAVACLKTLFICWWADSMGKKGTCYEAGNLSSVPRMHIMEGREEIASICPLIATCPHRPQDIYTVHVKL